jgi:Cof subfamily protein (haloacid dehalogenase superfamily)
MSINIDPNKIKALAMDLDGTLLAPGPVLTERAIRAVKACIKRGLRIIIATGRAIDAAEPFRAALGVEGPIICFNGAAVADMPGGTLLSTTLLDKEAVEFCIDLSRETGVYYQVYFPGTSEDPRIILMTEKDSPERAMYHNHTGLLAELGDLREALRRPGISGCVKTMFLAEPEVQATLRPKLDEHFGDSVYIAKTYRTFLELMNAGVSKGQGLRFALERLSIKAEETIAFGDEENDIPMFKAAGFSVAPSNAKESVKAAASTVIGSNAEDGVAVFLEELFKL